MLSAYYKTMRCQPLLLCRALLCSVSFFILNATPEDDWKAIRPKVGSLLESGRKEEAIQLLTGLVEQHPDAAELHAQLGMVHYQLRDYDNALLCLGRAVQLDDSSIDYTMNLVDVLLADRRFPVALKLLSAVEPKFRGTVPFHYNWALAYYGARDFTASLRQFREVSRIDPQFAPAHYFQGNCLAAAGNYDQAEAAYRKALRLRPEDPTYLFALGKVLQLAGPERLNDSIGLLEQSVKLDRTYIPSLLYLGLGYEKAGQYDRARVLLEEVATRQPDQIEPHAALARIYYRLKMQERGDASAALVRKLRDRSK
jgi:tetratricopeptide (TPR) repeat protein